MLFYGSLVHIIYWNEQYMPLFRFSDMYFTIHLSQPTGLLKYITSFLTQFFYYPLLGSFIIALLLSSVFILNAIIIRKLSGLNDKFLLSLFPVLYLTIQCFSIDFPISAVIGIVINQIFFIICLKLPLTLKKYSSYLFLLLSFYITGCISALLLLLFIVDCFLNKKYCVLILLSILYMILLFAAGYYYRIPLADFSNLGLSNSLLTNAILLFLPTLPVLLGIFLLKRLSKRKSLTVIASVIIVCISIVSYGILKKIDVEQKIIINADRYAIKSDWTKVLDITSKCHYDNQTINYIRNMALYYTGKMGDELFNYPQNHGARSLYLVWDHKTNIEYGDLVFANLGFYNEATHWAFEAMVLSGETSRTLHKLVKYNTSNSKYLIAKQFNNILKETLFYAKQAQNTELLLEEEIKKQNNNITTDTAIQNLYTNLVSFPDHLLYMCNNELDNRMAFEYLMSYYLLRNRVVDFVNNLWRIKNFPDQNLPNNYQEAIVICAMAFPEKLEGTDWRISDNIIGRFGKYNDLYRNTNGNAKELEKLFGKTYWYYINFKSPYGNKIFTE